MYLKILCKKYKGFYKKMSEKMSEKISKKSKKLEKKELELSDNILKEIKLNDSILGENKELFEKPVSKKGRKKKIILDEENNKIIKQTKKEKNLDISNSTLEKDENQNEEIEQISLTKDEKDEVFPELKSGKWKYRPRKLRDKNPAIVIKSTPIQYNFNNDNDELDNIILHLNITKKDIEESKNLIGNQFNFVYTPFVQDPIPAEPDTLTTHIGMVGNNSGTSLLSSSIYSENMGTNFSDLDKISLEDIEKRRNDELLDFKHKSYQESSQIHYIQYQHSDNKNPSILNHFNGKIIENATPNLQKQTNFEQIGKDKINENSLEIEDKMVKQNEEDNEEIFAHEKFENNDKNIPSYIQTIHKRIVKKQFIPILYEFVDTIQKTNSIHSISPKKEYPLSTKVACWWCCHSFKEIPCFIPSKFESGIFYLYGNFCTFNCCASYIFSRNREDQWEQYSLLNLLYKTLFKKYDVKIQLAPPKECLKMFGGFMDIDEYRKASLSLDKDYNILYPNFVMLIPRIEEIQYELTDTKIDKKFIPMNDKLLHQIERDFKLKREIPIVDKNKTLLNFLQNNELSKVNFLSI